MATIIMFHSMLGLRDLERDAASRLREAGHDVVLPDLYAGAHTDVMEEGYAIKAYTLCSSDPDPRPMALTVRGRPIQKLPQLHVGGTTTSSGKL